MNIKLEMMGRFLNKLSKTEGCWQWIGSKNIKGYGVFYITKKVRTGAHRASWVFYNGEIPNGLHVLHKCDNPPCVNPAHLFLGTNLDNVADKISKSRQPRPKKEKNPMWKNYKSAARGTRKVAQN